MWLLRRLIPIAILLSLLFLLWYELFYFNPNNQPSALLNEAVPSFQLTNLLNPTQIFSEQQLKGKVSLLNIWATWCYACQLEHEILINISKQYRIPIYSINYKDDPSKAKEWLIQKGNPYVMVGSDNKGDVGIDLGIYGTPETFIINAQGKIVYRHVGALSQTAWESKLYPIIKQLIA